MIYSFIKGHSSEFPVEKMCQILNVSRSNYYAWLNRSPSKRQQESGGIYGLDKIHQDVKAVHPCSRKRVYRLMKANNITSKRPRKFKATTNSKHNR